MSRQEIEDLLLTVVRDLAGDDGIVMSTCKSELRLDSIDLTEVVITLENKLRTSLDIEALAEWPDDMDLHFVVDMVEKSLAT